VRNLPKVCGHGLVTCDKMDHRVLCAKERERECEDKGGGVVVIVCFPSWKLAFVCASSESWSLSFGIS
jgi:hypothetical protein